VASFAELEFDWYEELRRKSRESGCWCCCGYWRGANDGDDVTDEECDSPRIAWQYTEQLRPKRLVSIRLISHRRQGVSHGTSSPTRPSHGVGGYYLQRFGFLLLVLQRLSFPPLSTNCFSLSDIPANCFRHFLCVFYQATAFHQTHMCALWGWEGDCRSGDALAMCHVVYPPASSKGPRG